MINMVVLCFLAGIDFARIHNHATRARAPKFVLRKTILRWCFLFVASGKWCFQNINFRHQTITSRRVSMLGRYTNRASLCRGCCIFCLQTRSYFLYLPTKGCNYTSAACSVFDIRWYADLTTRFHLNSFKIEYPKVNAAADRVLKPSILN